MNARLLAEVPDGFTVSGHEAAAFEASILAMFTALVTDRPFVTPQGSVTQVRWAARQGMSLDAVQRILWNSHAEVQAALIDIVTTEVDGDELAREVKRLSSVLLEVVATLIRDLSAVFDHESAAWGRDRAAVIRRVVDRIVETGERPADAEELLGIRLSDYHLAAVVCPEGTDDPRWRPDFARRVDSVGERLDAATVLVIPRTAAPAVWNYDDHGAMALLMSDPVACRDFVQRMLAGLLGGDSKVRAMRATLLAYFGA